MDSGESSSEYVVYVGKKRIQRVMRENKIIRRDTE